MPASLACPICQGPGTPCYWAAEYRMYRCGTCRTAFVSPMPDAEQLARFYSLFHQSQASGGWYDQVESRMQADFPAKVALVKEAMAGRNGQGRDGRVLDVGCGKGYFVRACMDAGLQAEGIDLSDTAVAHAREQLGVKATAGLLADKKASLGLFDCLTFWATIEHVPDPVGMLRDMWDLLAPGGVLLVDTGIGDDWLDRTLPGLVQWYDPPQHLFVFSAPGLRKALEAAGFEVLRHDPCFDRSASRRLARRVRNIVAGTALRAAASLGRLQRPEFAFTRFPMGNLQSVWARKVSRS